MPAPCCSSAREKYREAVPLLDQALALDPRDEAALKLRLFAHGKLNQLAETRADLDELIKLKPNDAPCWPRGRGVAGMKQIDAGMADVERALTMDPNNGKVYVSRGIIKRMQKKLPEAIADFDRAIELAPKEANAFTERGATYFGMNQYEKALPDFDQALALNWFDDRARASRGLALIFRGSASEGLPDVNAVLERDPANSAALFGRGLAMLASGQYDRAIVALNQITMAAGEDDAGMRLVRARAYLGKGDAAGAMPDLNAILAARPGDAPALTLRGKAHSAQRDYAKALADLDQAIEKQETVEGFTARADVFEAQNQVEKAAADLRRATQLAPKQMFDIVAQANAKQKLQQLSKKIPCDGGGSPKTGDTCL